MGDPTCRAGAPQRVERAGVIGFRDQPAAARAKLTRSDIRSRWIRRMRGLRPSILGAADDQFGVVDHVLTAPARSAAQVDAADSIASIRRPASRLGESLSPLQRGGLGYGAVGSGRGCRQFRWVRDFFVAPVFGLRRRAELTAA